MTTREIVAELAPRNILGTESDDTLLAQERADGAWQYLSGFGGNDTYYYGTDSGLTYIYARDEDPEMGENDRVVFLDLNLEDFTLGWQDYRESYPSEQISLSLLWDNGALSGQIQIGNGGKNIEEFVFADGTTMTARDIVANLASSHQTGTDGDDTFLAQERADGAWQYLSGYSGNDTYYYGTDSGLTYIYARDEGLEMGTLDRVVFLDLNLDDITIGSQDYRDSYSSEQIALVIMWETDDGSGQLQIGDGGEHIEEFVFADGTVMEYFDFL